MANYGVSVSGMPASTEPSKAQAEKVAAELREWGHDAVVVQR